MQQVGTIVNIEKTAIYLGLTVRHWRKLSIASGFAVFLFRRMKR